MYTKYFDERSWLIDAFSERIPIVNYDIMYVKATHDSPVLPISRGKL